MPTFETTKRKRGPRKPTNRAHMTTYLWESIPTRLLNDVKAKLAKQRPPTPLKWLLLELLQKWNDDHPSA